MSLLVVRLDGAEVAFALDTVREVIRMPSVRAIPGSARGLMGLAEVREETVRVLDPRSPEAVPARDLVVLDRGDALACDEVLGVRAEDDEVRRMTGLPAYARGILSDGALLVDLRQLLDSRLGS